jgi:hypothetical protein
MKFEFDTQPLPSVSRLKERFSGHRFTFDENVKHATITWSRKGNITFYIFEMD